MKNIYTFDTGIATASAIQNFTVVKATRLVSVSWNASVFDNGANCGMVWVWSLSPVANDSVALNDTQLSRVVSVVNWRTAASMVATAVNYVDQVNIQLAAGQIIYLHRAIVINAPSATTMSCLLKFS